MDARFLRTHIFLGSAVVSGLWLALFSIGTTQAAGFRTQNFIVQAPTPALAKAVGESAEKYRDDLANYWLGKALPAWPSPCPIRVVAGKNLAAQGVTTYNRAPVRDFQMEVVGTPERILDSVLPHEVTHTVLATHFGRPLPRWADEGICTTVEHESERNKHEAKLREFLSTRRGIAMNQLFLLTEYPSDVLPMYAQGYSVCQFLIAQKDAKTFIAFLQDYMQRPSWTENIRKHYGYESLGELQQYWLAWVAEGSGPVEKFTKLDRSPHRQLPNRQSPINRGSGDGAMNSLAANQNRAPASGQRNQIAQVSGIEALPAPTARSAGPPMELNEPARGTALAAVASDGWYQRQMNDTAGQHSGPTTNQRNGLAASGGRRSPAITPIVPPSIRQSGPYRAAQPQPEMRMSRTGQAYGSATDWADGSARYR